MSAHRISRKLDRYADVRVILTAMKNTALMEMYKLSARIERQDRLLETVARAAFDFAAFYPLRSPCGAGVCIVIGTERGFCGEFNAELVAPLLDAREHGESILVVGSRLAERLAEEQRFETIPGATVAEEILTVLEKVASWLEKTQARGPGFSANVKVLYQDENRGNPVLKTVAPLPVPKQPYPVLGYAPGLTLNPPDFIAALGEQALLLSLEGYFTLSLAAENRRRFEHMESALKRLDEMTAMLRRKMNAARQADIIQEIETIMLGSSGS